MNMKTDIRQMLKSSGWTQNQLAKAAGVHFTSLSRFLSGKGEPSVAERLVPFVYGDKRPSNTPEQVKSEPHAPEA